MKPSQQQPKVVERTSHLTRASSTSADNASTLFGPGYNDTTTYASDISHLINASHVSHAIASSYHALTTHALHQHKRRHALPRSSVDLNTTRAHQASQVSASLDELHVELPPYLHTKVAEDNVFNTPMAYFEEYPSPQYQQLGNYHSPAGLQSSYTQLRPTPKDSQEFNDSMRAEFGTQEHSYRGLTYWVLDRERYMHVRRNDRDMIDWGEDLSGIGAQFDNQTHSEEAAPNSGVGEEGWNTTWVNSAERHAGLTRNDR
ncbi:hypothetical protein ONS96_005348 [Cadophora gregata f. sp. sojae]|nr:hypothetical protein ONS96_005348 [Cadophora gregata f. sp. sojae]